MLSKLHGRRRFVQNAALFSAGLITTLGYSRLAKASDEPVTAVVIGSGFGGAIAALRLAQAGIRTVLLERGRRWQITPAQDTFATYRHPDGRAAWLSSTTYSGVPVDVYTGILESRAENGITVLCGAGVGGGSLVYNTFTLQPVRELFYKTFPREVDYDELDQVYYPRVRSILKPSPIPADILASSYYQSSRVFIEQASNTGLPYIYNDMNVDWDIVRQEIAGTKVPSAIAAEVFYGNNSGAKNSVDRNYLLQAEQTGLVEVLPLHEVTDIAEASEKHYRVSYNEINESGEVITNGSLTCRYLFLAAGSMGTSRLLVRAKAKSTLPRLNEHIGKYWGSNGDYFASRSGLPPTNPQQGGPAFAITIRDVDNPFGPVGLTGQAIWNAFERTEQCFGQRIPLVRGSFRYDAATDSVKLDWPTYGSGVEQNLKAAQFIQQTLDEKNTDGTYKPTTIIDESTTVHPLGGAVLGKACDLYGRVKGYRGLYVVDGALIEAATGCVAPSLTIAAMAERCMERIIAEDISRGSAFRNGRLSWARIGTHR